MLPLFETIVTTANAKGEVHISRRQGSNRGGTLIIAPFKPSKTLDNLRENPFAAATHPCGLRAPARRGRLFRCPAIKGWGCAPIAYRTGNSRSRPLPKISDGSASPAPSTYRETDKPWAGFYGQAAVSVFAAGNNRATYLKSGPREEEALSWLMKRSQPGGRRR